MDPIQPSSALSLRAFYDEVPVAVGLNSKVSIPEDVLFHELSGEAVLLNLQNGKYYGLNEVGTRLWMLLAENGDLAAATQTLLAEYDVDEERLRQDITTLVERLVEQGLMAVEI